MEEMTRFSVDDALEAPLLISIDAAVGGVDELIGAGIFAVEEIAIAVVDGVVAAFCCC